MTSLEGWGSTIELHSHVRDDGLAIIVNHSIHRQELYRTALELLAALADVHISSEIGHTLNDRPTPRTGLPDSILT